MILVDTGPLVALFDPRDSEHARCKSLLQGIHEPLTTTVPVLTEAFHMLDPNSRGSDNLRTFVMQGGAGVWFMDSLSIERAFELMEVYADRPMDLADASIVVAAEVLSTRKVFTIDRNDFATYRIRQGHRYFPADVIS